jgi:hypothetical protein
MLKEFTKQQRSRSESRGRTATARAENCTDDPALKRVVNCGTLYGALKGSFPQMNVEAPTEAGVFSGG